MGGIDALVETEDEELTRPRPPLRRGGGGGGTFEAVVGGDCDKGRDSTDSSSDIGVERSELVNGFGLSWLCLRESGGAGGSRFCELGLAWVLDESELNSRLGIEMGSLLVSTARPGFDEGGKGGSGLSISEGVPGDLGVGWL